MAAIELLKIYGENPEVLELLPVVKEGLNGEEYSQYEQDILKSIEVERRFQKKAIEYYEKGILTLEKQDHISSTLYLLGELHRRLGENEMAKEYYKKSMKVGEMPGPYKLYVEGLLKKL